MTLEKALKMVGTYPDATLRQMVVLVSKSGLDVAMSGREYPEGFGASIKGLIRYSEAAQVVLSYRAGGWTEPARQPSQSRPRQPTRVEQVAESKPGQSKKRARSQTGPVKGPSVRPLVEQNPALAQVEHVIDALRADLRKQKAWLGDTELDAVALHALREDLARKSARLAALERRRTELLALKR
jgi:hypothetical protein